MVNRILKVFLVLVLLSLPTSGQNSQQHLICKNVESVFSDDHDGSTVPHRRRIPGSPGKRGPAGIKGERGMPGVQGIAGSPAIVDYDRIFEKIENKTRQELQEMNSRFEKWQRTVTELQAGLEDVISKLEILQSNVTELFTVHGTGIKECSLRNEGQRCREENGLPYNDKCYFAPPISSSNTVNYNQAVQKCSSSNSLLAEFHSLAHQKAVQDFFRPRIPSSTSSMYLYIGMTYQSSEGNLRFRSGMEVSIDQFKWLSGYPSGSYAKMRIFIQSGGDNEGIYNNNPGDRRNGVICEKPL